MYNHNKAQQSKNRVRISWDLLYIPWWRNQMETFSALLALCAGNSPVTNEFPAWINGWVNNREAGDFRRHRAHYDVIVMCWQKLFIQGAITSPLVIPGISFLQLSAKATPSFLFSRAVHLSIYYICALEHRSAKINWSMPQRTSCELWYIYSCWTLHLHHLFI